MPALTWSDINTNFTPLPAWRFFVSFPPILAPNPKTLAINAQRVSIPILNMDPDIVPFGPSVRAFAATRTTDPLTVTFCEDTSFSVIDMFISWTQLVIDSLGNFSLASTYWQPISFEPILNDGKSGKKYTFNHCWPTHIAGLDWDGSTVGHITPTITFATDPLNNFNGYSIVG